MSTNEQRTNFEQIEKILKAGRYSHAYLFESNDKDIIKNTVYPFVKRLVCPLNKKNVDCGECNICNRIDNGMFYEVNLIEKDGINIKKEQLISLFSALKNKPVEGKKLIYIIKNCDNLNTSSANTLLKYLEEPEDDVIAILTTNNISKVINTIVSRCFIVNINNTRDLKLFNEDAVKFIKFFEEKKLDTILYLNELVLNKYKTREEFTNFVNECILIYEEVLVNKKNDIINIDSSRCVLILRKLMEVKENLEYNVNQSLQLDKLLIDIEGGIDNV